MDIFPTKPWAIERFLEDPFCPLPRSGLFLEPCAGDGAIVRTFQTVRPNDDVLWAVTEIRPECESTLATLPKLATPPIVGDFLEDDGEDRVFDAAFTNPPFVLAEEFLLACLRRCRHVCFLLRMGFLESEGRNDFMARCPPDVFQLPNRPDFDPERPGKTDAASYSWLAWDAENLERPRGYLRVLAHTPKEVRRPCAPRKPRASTSAPASSAPPATP